MKFKSSSRFKRHFFGLALSIITLNQTLAFAQLHQDSKYDKDAEAIDRVPPIVPPQASGSGYCCMAFDINRTGKPINIKTRYCTEDMFSPAAKNAVSQWLYSPAENGGKTVVRTGVGSTLVFRLTGIFGQVIAGPTGYMAPIDIKNLEPAPFSGSGRYSEWLEKNFETETPCGNLLS